MAKDKITAIKRSISKLNTHEELQQICRYIYDREKVFRQRDRQAKIEIKWQRIAALPVGSSLVVNTKGISQFPRGTQFEITAFSTRGPRCVHLKSPDGKVYPFSRSNVDYYDLWPADQVDLTKLGPMVI